jgi:mannose-1-phosphate guanylyltransferase
MKNTYAVIMAGGGGTRLWPISRKDRPKQTLTLIGDETLFQSTVAAWMGSSRPNASWS